MHSWGGSKLTFASTVSHLFGCRRMRSLSDSAWGVTVVNLTQSHCQSGGVHLLKAQPPALGLPEALSFVFE